MSGGREKGREGDRRGERGRERERRGEKGREGGGLREECKKEKGGENKKEKKNECITLEDS